MADYEERPRYGLSIEGITISAPEFLVVVRNSRGKVVDITTELDGPPVTFRGAMIKGGIDHCSECGYPYGEKIRLSLSTLGEGKEMEVKCKACGTRAAYYKKPIPFDEESVKAFLKKYLLS